MTNDAGYVILPSRKEVQMTDQAPKRKTRGLGANQKAVIRAMEPGKGYSRHALQTLCNISIWQARSALAGCGSLT